MDELITNEILRLIKDKSLSKEELKEALSQYHESDIADSIALLDEDERNEFLNSMSKEELAEIIPFFDNPEEYSLRLHRFYREVLPKFGIKYETNFSNLLKYDA